MKSLRKRALLGGILWATMSILIGSFGLFSYIDSVSRARFDEALRSRHTQAIVALGNNSDTMDNIMWSLTDPDYLRPFSGRYWQFENSTGEVWASRSLVDSLLTTPVSIKGAANLWSGIGPNSEPLRGIQQQVILENGTVWEVVVADDLTSLQTERSNLRQNLFLAFGLITLIGILGAIFLIYNILRPLNKLRQEVASRWDSEEGLQPDEYPEEVAPLVTDINTLLARNREVISRSKRQAADLAHALKTPAAIMRNELETLDRQSNNVDAAIEALNRIDAQLMRSLARIRASGNVAMVSVRTELDTSLARMLRAFRSLPASDDKTILDEITQQLSVPMDQQDFEEVIGNILDNALKWCATTVRVSARPVESDIVITISDDGPGIKDADKRMALVSGGRLDTASPGTGLGLAIASDLLQAYGGSLQLERSKRLGGLAVIIKLPTKRKP